MAAWAPHRCLRALEDRRRHGRGASAHRYLLGGGAGPEPGPLAYYRDLPGLRLGTGRTGSRSGADGPLRRSSPPGGQERASSPAATVVTHSIDTHATGGPAAAPGGGADLLRDRRL